MSFFFFSPPTSIFRPRCRHGTLHIYIGAEKGEKKLGNNGCRAAGREDETIGKSLLGLFFKEVKEVGGYFLSALY
jgi:hypothetical protein